jgi:DNA-3-methyladenine glycosylase II
MRDARAYLRQADRVIARLIDARPDFDPRSWLAECPPMDLYGALLFQVTGQQLSVKATRRIIARIQALFGGRRPAAGELLAVDPGELRTAGAVLAEDRHAAGPGQPCGRRPAGPGGPARHAGRRHHRGAHRHFRIGPWTVQGALIIALHRADVVLPGDLALRKAVQAVYQLGHMPSPDEVLAIAEPWRPYRSLATSYLFSAALDGSAAGA